jgi:hypothetical protein
MGRIGFHTNINQFLKALEAADKARIKAAQTAVKVEASRLVGSLKNPGVLKREIMQAAPGGRTFSPLRQIGAHFRAKQMKGKPPLYRMAVPVRYRVHYEGNNMTVQIGYVDPSKGGRISKSWVRLAQLHQAGGKLPVTEDIRRGLAAIGARMKRRKITRNKANVFFLKPTTTQVDIPARPIIGPFWQAHKAEAEQNIAVNFYRKMRGERI